LKPSKGFAAFVDCPNLRFLISAILMCLNVYFPGIAFKQNYLSADLRYTQKKYDISFRQYITYKNPHQTILMGITNFN
jgi:hypothetical protein